MGIVAAAAGGDYAEAAAGRCGSAGLGIARSAKEKEREEEIVLD